MDASGTSPARPGGMFIFQEEHNELVPMSTPASSVALPPPRLPEDFPLLLGGEGSRWGLASPHGPWCNEAKALAQSWWLHDARYALLALIRSGVSLQTCAGRLKGFLLTGEEPPGTPLSGAMACPFPDADVLEAVWDQLCDMCHPGACVPSPREVHRRLSRQVLSIPRLAHWVRKGRASQVTGFLLSSQWDFLMRRPHHEPLRQAPLMPTAPQADSQLEPAPKATAAMHDEWFASRAPAVLTAHLLLGGQRNEALVTMGVDSTDNIDHLIIEEMMAEDIQNVPAAACMQEMDLLNRSWQAFASSRAERAARKQLVVQARRACQSERSQKRHQRELLLAAPPVGKQSLGHARRQQVCRRNQ